MGTSLERILPSDPQAYRTVAGRLSAAKLQPAAPARVANLVDVRRFPFSLQLGREPLRFAFESAFFCGFPARVKDVHHGLSLHNSDPAKLAQLTTIDTWQVSIIARFIVGLEANEEEDGALLYRTLMAMSSELADGAARDDGNLAVLLAGGGGVITGNRHVRVGSPGRPADIAKPWLSMLRGLGVDEPTFGDFGQSQPMEGLRA